ncbi:BQ5605_C008g05021 [Microbotryum silenes-dioicae]|uniref:BQ5605_C008g05021 protein n=1 Tax=Microbotryum silenes-dioicae TaxID=796604 RepID=A0A2X0MGI9_9BASI|nr:BQ5605_C008g05021 [Microbotryum silenes-dioicae]
MSGDGAHADLKPMSMSSCLSSPEAAVAGHDASAGPSQLQGLAKLTSSSIRPREPSASSHLGRTEPTFKRVRSGSYGHTYDRSPTVPYAVAASASSSQCSPALSTMASSQLTPLSAGGSTTRRQVQSCAECKRRKIKCDRVYPCAPCQMRGDADSCEKPETNPGTPSPIYDSLFTRMSSLESTMRALQHKIAQLEDHGATRLRQASSSGSTNLKPSAVTDAGAGVGANGVASTRRLATSTSSSSAALGSSTHAPVRPSTASTPTNDAVNARGERGQPPEEEMALMLEDIAMSFNANKSRLRQAMNPLHQDSGSLRSASVRHERARMMNPLSVIGAQRSWILVETYFGRIEWYTKSLHTPSFIVECKSILHLDPEEAHRTTRTSFLCVLYMILCCSLHLIEPYEAQALGYSLEDASMLAEDVYHCGLSMLSNSDWLRHPSLEYLQSIIVAGVFMYNTSAEADVHWALLGSAIKCATNLGLSRLGWETDGKKWPPAWKSFRRRETGRRIWWGLVVLDWSHAQAHNGTSDPKSSVPDCVHPSQNHTAPPSNVNDADMNDDYVSRPLSQYTESTMTILKLRFVTLYREFVDHLNVNQLADYDFIVEMDGRICDVIADFPEYFSSLSHPWQKDRRWPNLEKEALLIQITAANRHLRLHRPYLMRGYHDSKYHASTERCVSSARSVLVLLRQAGERCPEIFRLWIVSLYQFVASIVCFIDLLHKPSIEMRATLRESVELLKLASSNSAAARMGVKVLEGLLAAEQDITSVPGKRPRLDLQDEESNSPFRNVVNHLLLSASSEVLPYSSSAPKSEPYVRTTAESMPGVAPWNIESSIAAALAYGELGFESGLYGTASGVHPEEYGQQYAWSQAPPRSEDVPAGVYNGVGPAARSVYPMGDGYGRPWPTEGPRE